MEIPRPAENCGPYTLALQKTPIAFDSSAIYIAEDFYLRFRDSPGACCKYKTGRHNREVGNRSSHATLSSREIGRSRQDRFQTAVFCSGILCFICHAPWKPCCFPCENVMLHWIGPHPRKWSACLQDRSCICNTPLVNCLGPIVTMMMMMMITSQLCDAEIDNGRLPSSSQFSRTPIGMKMTYSFQLLQHWPVASSLAVKHSEKIHEFIILQC